MSKGNWLNDLIWLFVMSYSYWRITKYIKYFYFAVFNCLKRTPCSKIMCYFSGRWGMNIYRHIIHLIDRINKNWLEFGHKASIFCKWFNRLNRLPVIGWYFISSTLVECKVKLISAGFETKAVTYDILSNVVIHKCKTYGSQSMHYLARQSHEKKQNK